MAKPPPPPSTLPPPPAIDPTPAFQTFAESIAQQMSDELLGLLGVGSQILPGVGEMITDSETVLITTSNVIGNIQSYRIPRDGWIVGVSSAQTANWVLSLNVDPPAAAPTGTGITTGLVWPQGANIGTAGSMLAGNIRQPVFTNDILNLKTYAASVITVLVLIAYPRLAAV